LYIGLIRARSRYASRYADRSKVWKIPGGMFVASAVAIWGTVFNTLAIYYVFDAPWTPDAPVDTWRTWLAGISIGIVAAGVLIFLAGRRKAEAVIFEEELRKYDTKLQN
jgi:hypothetical protein